MKKSKLLPFIIVISIVLVFVVGIIVGILITKNVKVNKALDLGQKYLEEEDYKNALVSFEDAIAIDDKNVEAYSGAAKAYIGMEDYESAVKILEKGIKETDDRKLKRELKNIKEEQNKNYSKELEELVRKMFEDKNTNLFLSALFADCIYEDPNSDAILMDSVSDNTIGSFVVSYLRLKDGDSTAPKAEVDKVVRAFFGERTEMIYTYNFENYDGTPGLIYENNTYIENVQADGETIDGLEIAKCTPIDNTSVKVLVDAFYEFDYRDYKEGLIGRPEVRRQWEVVFEWDEGSMYGCRPKEVKLLDGVSSESSGVTISSVNASSELSERGMTHSADRLIDGNMDTAWVEGVSGQGEGEQVVLNLSKKSNVSGIIIYPGYQKNQDVFNKNSRPKSITISYDGGSMDYSLSDGMGAQTISFDHEVSTEKLVITINSVFPGNKYKDTVITEVSVF